MTMTNTLAVKKHRGKQSEAVIGLLLLLALSLRVFYARQISLFIDEFTTIWAAQRILDTGLPVFPSGNFYSHGMVFTYIEAVFRMLGGTDTFVARLPGVIIGVTTVAAVYFVGTRLFNRPTALLAAAWLAADPDAIIWGGRARMYALLQLLVLLATYFLYRGAGDESRLRDRIAAMILLTAALFTQPEAALLLPVFGLIVLWQRGLRGSLRPAVWLPFGIPAAGLAIIYLLNKLGQPGHLEAIQESRPYFRLPGHIMRGVEIFAPSFVASWRLPATLLFAAGLVWLVIRAVRREPLSGSWQPLLATYIVFVPILLVLVFLVGPTWQRERYAFMLWPFFYLAAAQVAWHFASRRFRSDWPWYGIVALLAALTLITGWRYAYAQVEGYDLAFTYVRDHWQPGDAIASPVPAASMLYLGQSDYFAIQRAYQEYVMQHDGREVDRWTDAAPLVTPAGWEAALRAHPRLWFVVDGWRFETRYDLDVAQLVLAQMKVAYSGQGTVAFLAQGYTPPATPAVTRTANANFAGEIRLARYERFAARPKPGSTMRLDLQWQALNAAERKYTLFLHLLDRDGRMVGQSDERILGGRYRPLFWPHDASVRDVHTLSLPPDLQAGRYRLVAGLYDGTPDHALRVVDDQGRAVADTVTLDYLQIGPSTAALPQTRLTARFGDQVELLGYDLQPTNGHWSLTLYWRAAQPVENDYTVFVHLVGPDGQIWAQDDAAPGGGFFPTSFWQSGDTVTDTHELTLPEDVPAGIYHLVVGLYQPGSGARLPVRTGSTGPADHLTLSTFSLHKD